MRIMEIVALPNGAHRNQLCDTCEVIPAGWAVVPDTLAVPNFPLGSATVEPCGGVATVTAWVPGVVPEAEDEPTEPSQAERLAALEAENTPTEPTTKERLDDLEAALAQTDEAAIELYEANEEQIQINAAQDEALIEIYEMLEV